MQQEKTGSNQSKMASAGTNAAREQLLTFMANQSLRSVADAGPATANIPVAGDLKRSNVLRGLDLDRPSRFFANTAVREAIRAGALARKPAGGSQQVSLNNRLNVLPGMTATIAAAFNTIGISTVGDLAAFAEEVEGRLTNGDPLGAGSFRERPSAPPGLMPEIVGAVATSVRFSSFVEEVFLDEVKLKTNDRATGLSLAVSSAKAGAKSSFVTGFANKFDGLKNSKNIPGLSKLDQPGRQDLAEADKVRPLSGASENLAPQPLTTYSLSTVFDIAEYETVRLGFLLEHRQKFTNLGTSLGEVVHSLCLIPGESRQIATVNWRRRQLASLEQESKANEILNARFVQTRALEEVTRATAIEHQTGGTRSEASTAATSGALVGAFALAGGIAGGITGGLIGAPLAGVGAAPGAALGAAAGSFVGGLAGSAAAGLVWAGSQALGTIEANSAGDREVAGRVNQSITLSTNQNAATSRSLWGTSVLEDVQTEAVGVETRSVTNYNHMHTLNIEYFELLTRYLSTVDIEQAFPILFLPFTHLPFQFDELDFIRDYWHVIREFIDEDVRGPADIYLAAEDVPAQPDLVPVPAPPPEPVSQGTPALRVTDLAIAVFVEGLGVGITTPVGLSCEIKLGGRTITPTSMSSYSNNIGIYDRGELFSFPDISNAGDIEAVQIVADWAGFNIGLRVTIEAGSLIEAGGRTQNLAGIVIQSGQELNSATHSEKTINYSFRPARELLDTINAVNQQAERDYRRAVMDRAQAIRTNEILTENYQRLIRNSNRAIERMMRAILRRQHFFTRIILSALDPEEVEALLGPVTLVAGQVTVRLRDVAHLIPIGMTTGAFVLRMKTFEVTSAIAEKLLAAPALVPLANWPTEVRDRFGTADARAAHSRSEQVYLPTGGLFAEALLGRANGAEFLDAERYFDWQSSPIPHQATAIAAVSTESRFQQTQPLSVQAPDGTINLISPVSLPDSTSLQAAIGAVQNGGIFGDMSKSAELVTVLGALAKLAGDMGQNASRLTGDANQQAMKQAGDIGQSVAAMTGQAMSDAMTGAGGAFNSMTKQGAALNEVRKQFPAGETQDKSVARILGIEPPAAMPPATAPATGVPAGGAANTPFAPPAPGVPADRLPFNTTLPELPRPGDTPGQPVQQSQVQRDVDAALLQLMEPSDDPNRLAAGTPEDFTGQLEKLYAEVVKPGLDQAINDDRVLLSALRAFDRWRELLRLFEPFGIDLRQNSALAQALVDATAMATAGLRTAVLQANQRAAATNDWRYVFDALDWADIAETMALVGGETRLQRAEVLAAFDLKIVLSHNDLPQALADGDTANGRLSARMQIASNPPIVREALRWAITVVGGVNSGPASGLVTSQGDFFFSLRRDGEPFEVKIGLQFAPRGLELRTFQQTFNPALA